MRLNDKENDIKMAIKDRDLEKEKRKRVTTTKVRERQIEGSGERVWATAQPVKGLPHVSTTP